MQITEAARFYTNQQAITWTNILPVRWSFRCKFVFLFLRTCLLTFTVGTSEHLRNGLYILNYVRVVQYALDVKLDNGV